MQEIDGACNGCRLSGTRAIECSGRLERLCDIVIIIIIIIIIIIKYPVPLAARSKA
jgi:hypothetical protein